MTPHCNPVAPLCSPGTKEKNGNLGVTNHRLVVGRIDPRTTLAFFYEGPDATLKEEKGRSSRKQKRRLPGEGSHRRLDVGAEMEDEWGVGDEDQVGRRCRSPTFGSFSRVS